MYTESAGKLFLKYAVPQMIGLLFNSVYVIVDGVFIGMRLGSAALAAAGVAVPVVELLIALSIGMTSGAGVVISGRLAAGNEKAARSAFMNALLVQGLLSAVIAVSGNVFLYPLAAGLGATPEILELTVTYLWYIVTLSPFLLFSYLLGGLARNDGRPGLAMAALSAGSLSNILLDYVFMYPLNMGIAGAALATAVGPVISVSILLPHFLLKKGHLYFRKRRPDADTLKLFVSLGLPSFVLEFSIGTVTFLTNFGIVRYGFGEEGLAAYLIIGYLMLIILTLFLGMAEGLQPAFSYLYAAGAREKLQKLLRIGFFVFLAAGVLSYVLVFFGSLYFYRMFTPEDEQLAVFAAETSKRYFAGFFCAGLNILLISYYQSVQDTRKALLLSSLRGFVLPAVFILSLPLLAGPSWLWICHSAAEVCTFCSGFVMSSCFFGRGRG